MRTMSQEEIKSGIDKGFSQCIVKAGSDGTICWDKSDSREREPVHKVKKGETFWCWNFKETENGYTHDYANMSPTDVPIETNVRLELIYITNDGDDPVLFEANVDKSPNIS